MFIALFDHSSKMASCSRSECSKPPSCAFYSSPNPPNANCFAKIESFGLGLKFMVSWGGRSVCKRKWQLNSPLFGTIVFFSFFFAAKFKSVIRRRCYLSTCSNRKSLVIHTLLFDAQYIWRFVFKISIVAGKYWQQPLLDRVQCRQSISRGFRTS